VAIIAAAATARRSGDSPMTPLSERLPSVALVGRPNVGKSTLFNALLGRRVSIEDPRPGVTRDRVTVVVEHEGRALELVDTGGMGIRDAQGLDDLVETQIARAVEAADLLLFVVDVRDGVTPPDRAVAERLRQSERPVLLVVNKVDHPSLEPEAEAFRALGFGDPVLVSAREKTAIRALLEEVFQRARGGGDPPEPPGMKLAIVGKRNAGKSTLINFLAREERMIVSEVPGTTRDSVDVRFERDGRAFVAIDTAGLRRRGSQGDSLDFLSRVRAERSIRRADVVFLVIEAPVAVSLVDKRLAEFVDEEARPCVVLVNKWDLARDVKPGKFTEYLRQELPLLRYAPIARVSALTGFGVWPALDQALELHRQAQVRVPTAELNRALYDAQVERLPRARGRREPRLYYGTQSGVTPPTIVLFVNDPALFGEDYLRFLEGRLRSAFDFAHVPIRFRLRRKRKPAPA